MPFVILSFLLLILALGLLHILPLISFEQEKLTKDPF